MIGKLASRTAVAIFVLGFLGILLFYVGHEDVFDVVVVNRDAGGLDNVKTRFEGYSFDVGVLSEQLGTTGGSTYGGYRGEWPEYIEVEWKAAGTSEIFIRRIAVPASLKFHSGERLQLIVEFKDGGVLVYPRVVEDFSKSGLKYRYQ